MDDTKDPRSRLRERVGSRAWIRTVGLLGGGLVAGGILAGTVTANAAAGEGATSAPSYSREEVTRAATAADGTTGDLAAAEDCPEGGGDAAAVPEGGTGSDSGAESDSDAAA